MANPVQLMDVNNISRRVATCMILHNMCVSDRVMGDVRATYNPAEDCENVATAPATLPPITYDANFTPDTVGFDEMPADDVEQVVARWNALADKDKCLRLQKSIASHLQNKFGPIGYILISTYSSSDSVALALASSAFSCWITSIAMPRQASAL